MSRNNLPAAHNVAKRGNVQSNISIKAMEKWQPLAMAGDSDELTYDVLQAVGEDWWAENEVTAASVTKFLNKANGRDISVNINSPGGDMFEGLAIYNILRAYSGKVTVNVVGIAASAASIIAMAADELVMGEGAFLMIHNAWVLAAGNRHELAATAEWLEPFDDSMASIYAARTGMNKAEISLLMDNESYINADKSVELGFADVKSESIATVFASSEKDKAAHRIDVLLAKQGVPRSERRRLFNEFKEANGTRDAADNGTHDAAINEAEVIEALKAMNEKFKK